MYSLVLVATTTASLALLLCMNLLSRMSSVLAADRWYSWSVGMPLCEVQVALAVFTLHRHRARRQQQGIGNAAMAAGNSLTTP